MSQNNHNLRFVNISERVAVIIAAYAMSILERQSFCERDDRDVIECDPTKFKR